MPVAHDPVVEHQAPKRPGRETERRSRRQPRHGAQHDGRIEVAQRGLRRRAHEGVEDEGQRRTDEPVVVYAYVRGSGTEHAVWADDTPYDARREESAAVGAREVTFLKAGADVGDVIKRPVHDCDLYESSPDGGDELCDKSGFGWDFHVVCEFEVLGEELGLTESDCAINFEDHDADGFSREHVPTNEG